MRQKIRSCKDNRIADSALRIIQIMLTPGEGFPKIAGNDLLFH